MLNNVQIKSLKIKGGAGTKPQGKPASNLVECVFHYIICQIKRDKTFHLRNSKTSNGVW